MYGLLSGKNIKTRVLNIDLKKLHFSDKKQFFFNKNINQHTLFNMKNKLLFTVLIFLFTNTAFAQDIKFFGSTFIETYSAEEYGFYPQVWDITQDQRGIMYFGTTTN